MATQTGNQDRNGKPPGLRQRCNSLCSLFSRIVFIAFFASPALVAADDTQTMLEAAIESYGEALEEKDRDRRLNLFARSEQLFGQVIDSQFESGTPKSALLVNKGNAALQAEHIGNAIHSFRTAMMLDPNNQLAAQNLAYARSVLPLWAQHEEESELMESLFFWRSLLATQSLKSLAAFCFLIASGLTALSFVKRLPGLRIIAVLLVICWGVLVVSMATKSGDSLTAVVTVPESTCYSANNENAMRAFSKPLPDGLEVKVLSTRGQWSEVEFAGTTGWVKSTVVRSTELP
ncbi:MAG: hypothetical protein AAF483_17300 [Planctomycetota bacterium]